MRISMLCMQKWQIMNLFIGCRVFYGVDSTYDGVSIGVSIGPSRFLFVAFLMNYEV